MPFLISLLCLWFLSVEGFCNSEEWVLDETRWEKTGESQGIFFFKQRVVDSNILAVRGEGVIRAEVWKLASIMLEAGRAKEWMDDVEESWIVERKSQTQYISYSHIGTPFMVKDRDFVMKVDILWDPHFEKFEMFYQPDTSGAGPSTPYVRGEVMGSFRLKRVEGGSHLIAEVHADPKGSVPVWVINMFQKNWAKKTFSALRDQVSKSDIGAPKTFLDLFGKVPESLTTFIEEK